MPITEITLLLKRFSVVAAHGDLSYIATEPMPTTSTTATTSTTTTTTTTTVTITTTASETSLPSCSAACMSAETMTETLSFGCWRTSAELSALDEAGQLAVLQQVLQDNVRCSIAIAFFLNSFFPLQVSDKTTLIDDGAAVAFLQQNGQTFADILGKTKRARRAEMEYLLISGYSQITSIPYPSEISVLLEYLAILREFQLLLPVISVTSTARIAQVTCQALNYSECRKCTNKQI